MHLDNTLPVQAVVLCGLPDQGEPSADPLTPVGGVPQLIHLLGAFRRSGITQALIVCGPEGAQVESLLGDGLAFGVAVRYLHDPDLRFGSGGALRQLFRWLHPGFLLYRVEFYPAVEPETLGLAFVEQGYPATMHVWRNQGSVLPSDCVVAAEEGGRARLLRYDPEPRPGATHLWCGALAMRRDLVDLLPPGYSELAGFLRMNALRGRIGAFEATSRCYHLRTPSGLAELRDAISAGALPRYAEDAPRSASWGRGSQR